MVKSKYFLLGYRKITVADGIKDYIARMIKAKISFEAISDDVIIIFDRDLEHFKKIFKNKSFEVSETLGIWGVKNKIRHKRAFCLATVIGIILVVLSRITVWDIRISGNETVPDTLILTELSECGFSVGTVWNRVSLSDIEYDMLDMCEEISWININRVGTVANVQVIERSVGADGNSEEIGYANIVADRDCVIEEITVSAGTPVVKVGDTVRKGQLLIMGVENNELGRLIRAEGVVVGRAYDSVCTTLARGKSVKVKKSESVISINIKIFDFPVNIFKKYGNSDTECDIIESKRRITLFGKYKLPITIETAREVLYEVKSESYNDRDLVSVCSVRHRQLLKSRLLGKDLSKITTNGGFFGDGYRIISDIVYSAEVGKVVPIGVE